MASALEKEKTKLVQDKCQVLLSALLKDEDNKYCVDCDAKSPRWASWNIGIFLCIRCAGIHRNLGVHISKVKSVNLDSWTPQQVASIEQMGNSRARAVYEANLPDTFRRPQSDSPLEQFVRAKYEAKKYVAQEWVQPPLPNPTWDADIERQLRKKKEKRSIGKIELASVAKCVPKSSNLSPKPIPKAPSAKSSPGLDKSRRSKTPVVTNNKSSALEDLLGLDSSSSSPGTNGTDSDPFGEFLSAPVSTPSKECAPTTTEIANEEANFFNQLQTDPTTSEKMTKDSILALYSKGPSHQAPKPMFGNFGSEPMAGIGVMNQQNGLNQPSAISMGHPQNPMLYQQPNSAFAMGQPQYFDNTVPSVPARFQLSSANPFAQVQSHLAGMSLNGGMSVPFMQNNSQFIQAPRPSSIGLNAAPANSLSNNLWQ